MVTEIERLRAEVERVKRERDTIAAGKIRAAVHEYEQVARETKATQARAERMERALREVGTECIREVHGMTPCPPGSRCAGCVARSALAGEETKP